METDKFLETIRESLAASRPGGAPAGAGPDLPGPCEAGLFRAPGRPPLEVPWPEDLVAQETGPRESEAAAAARADLERLREGFSRRAGQGGTARIALLEARCHEPEAKVASLSEALARTTAAATSQAREAVARALDRERREGARREREALERGRGQGRSLASERLGAAEADARSARREARAATARIDDLVAELAAVRDAGRQLEQERASRARAERDHAREVSRLENEVRRLGAELAQLRGREPEIDLGPVSGPLDAIRTIPHSLVEEVRLFSGLQDRVEFLPSALEAAANYHGGDLDRYWEALIAMHDVMWSLKFQEADVQISRDFRDRTGFQYAANESRETLEIESCRRARTFRYQGRDRLMTNHVKVGNSGNYADGALRIYFLFDEERRKLVVGHVGRHLPTKSFMRST